MLTDTAGAAQFALAMMACVTASAIPAFCCSDRPDCNFTITCGIDASFRSDFLPRGPEQDFVDVHVVRLADREGDHARERVRRDRRCRVELRTRAAASGSVTLSGSSVATAPGEMIVVRMLYGFTSCRSPSDSARTANLVAA